MFTPSIWQKWINEASLTLPFDALYADYELYTKPALQHTLANPEWFIEGTRRDPAFGTLSYLPVEIRCLIWQNLVGETMRLKAGLWPISSRSLRTALPLVGLEIDHLYFTTTKLHFDSYVVASAFWRLNLPPWKIPWVHHLSFTFGAGHDAHWIEWFRGGLPPNLETVTLDFDHDHGDRKYREYAKAMSGFFLAFGVQLLRGNNSGEKVISRRTQKLNFLGRKLQRDLALLEVVTKIIARTAPRAAIMLGPSNQNCKACHQQCKEILKEVENESLCPTGRVHSQPAEEVLGGVLQAC
ncbi:MAG: hypothetical protein LQ348_004662 [Seirophora lacunosa]|nr:MAG: hypothetical protein LQ348_004662 [Seirophora lacunosa]